MPTGDAAAGSSPATRPVRVAIINDDEVVVRGVNAMLREYGDRIEVAQMSARLPITEHVDIALFDTFAQSNGNGPTVASLLANPHIGRVVIYTWNFQPWLVRETMATGAHGYLSKSLTATELVSALLSIAEGEDVVSPDPGRRRLVGGDWPGREEGLTAREAEVLSLITSGMSNAEIAEHTCLSHNSIKSYIRSCYRKIEVTSRSQAVLWGIEHGLRRDRGHFDELN